MTRRRVPVLATLLAAACGGPALTPSVRNPIPAPVAELPAAAITPSRVALPSRLAYTSWRVQSIARIKVSGPGVSGAGAAEQRVESAGIVSWSADRQPSGALRAAGQVDSFTVRTSLDSQRGTLLSGAPSMILLEATLDSALLRVSTRPPLANECDRPEAGAAALARDLLVRVPDGARQGDRWRDSSVALICRSGVPMTVYTAVNSRLEQLSAERVEVRRELVSRVEGKGGSAFRGLELVGTASGSQRVEIAPQRGTVERLEGSGTLTLQVIERRAGSPPRVQEVVQRTELTAVRRER